jgi:hypothetical protein
MSDEKIVEVMARAICDGEGSPCCSWQACVDAERSCPGARLSEARAALSALRDAGYAVVPVEPTEAMLSAYWDSVEREHDALTMKGKAAARYRAMIAAANPSRPSPPEGSLSD